MCSVGGPPGMRLGTTDLDPSRPFIFVTSIAPNHPHKGPLWQYSHPAQNQVLLRGAVVNVHFRFIDSLGLELEDVKFIKASENPLVPVHVITRLLASSELASRKKLELSLPSFPDNMSAESGFLKCLCQQQVSLEQVFCSELGIIRTVQVLNFAYEKEVMRAASLPFIMRPGAMLQFAICYRVRGFEFWDNNGGCNFKMTCQTYKLTVLRPLSQAESPTFAQAF
uniref:Protein phosphatase 1, regulatory subunit 3Db n=1 Tax=Cyprinus carpio TaxID=7962 RepID=A0A8C1U270_CYPCA